MADPVINTAPGAFILGLLTSGHCAVMCGPWLCAALPKPSPAYHAGRILAYTSLGAAAGAMGMVPLRLLLKSPASLLPWMLALLLAVTALGWKPRFPLPRLFQRFVLRFRRRPHRAKGFALGLLTPLLPCGPLYLMLAACLVSGSAAIGAQFAFIFTLGTIPLLWVSQAGWSRLRQRVSPAGMRTLQRSMAALALLMVLWRLRPATPAPPDSGPLCPLCAGPETTAS